MKIPLGCFLEYNPFRCLIMMIPPPILTVITKKINPIKKLKMEYVITNPRRLIPTVVTAQTI